MRVPLPVDSRRHFCFAIGIAMRSGRNIMCIGNKWRVNVRRKDEEKKKECSDIFCGMNSTAIDNEDALTVR